MRIIFTNLKYANVILASGGVGEKMPKCISSTEFIYCNLYGEKLITKNVYKHMLSSRLFFANSNIKGVGEKGA